MFQKFALILFLISIQSLKGQEIFNPDLYHFNCEDDMEIGHVEKLYFVYNGDDEGIQTEELIIESTKATTKWIKKKANRNCRSADPNDCLVWCLVEVPAETISYQVIRDTLSTKDWHQYWHREYDLGETSNERVLCKNEITEELLDAIKTKLISRGADLNSKKKYKKLRKSLKKELNYFQKDSNLGVGRLSYETMAYLYKSNDR